MNTLFYKLLAHKCLKEEADSIESVNDFINVYGYNPYEKLSEVTKDIDEHILIDEILDYINKDEKDIQKLKDIIHERFMYYGKFMESYIFNYILVEKVLKVSKKSFILYKMVYGKPRITNIECSLDEAFNIQRNELFSGNSCCQAIIDTENKIIYCLSSDDLMISMGSFEYNLEGDYVLFDTSYFESVTEVNLIDRNFNQEKLLKNSKPLDNDISRIVNNNIMDLLA